MTRLRHQYLTSIDRDRREYLVDAIEPENCYSDAQHKSACSAAILGIMWWNLRHYVGWPAEHEDTTFSHSIWRILNWIHHVWYYQILDMNLAPGPDHEDCGREAQMLSARFPWFDQYEQLEQAEMEYLEKQAEKCGTRAIASEMVYSLKLITSWDETCYKTRQSYA